MNMEGMILVRVISNEPFLRRPERTRPLAVGRIPGMTVDREAAELAFRNTVVLREDDSPHELRGYCCR